MAGTNAYAAKNALLALIQADAAFANVQVEYSYPGLSHEMRESIWFDNEISGPVELVTMRGGAALKRGESLSTLLHIEVQKPGESVKNNEQRACVLGTAFEGVLAANPSLGDLTNLKLAQITSFNMTSTSDDEYAITHLAYGVTFTSHNT